jgi:glycerophosphoryl diester phosphodiesterase
MKTVAPLVVLLVAAVPTMTAPGADTNRESKTAMNPMNPLIVAHRGASKQAPENTLPAFNLAWEQGADAIEGDFRLTKDGQVVCIHDQTTERTTEANQVVARTTLQQLRKLDAGAWKAETFAGTRIPTLREVLATVPAGKRIYVEVKSGPEAVSPLLGAFRESGLDDSQIRVISFNQDVLKQLKAVAPQYRTSWLVAFKKKGGKLTPTHDVVLETLSAISADGLATAKDRVPESFIRRLQTSGVEHHVWTVDDATTAKRFAAWGTRSITTNVPDRILKALGRQPAEPVLSMAALRRYVEQFNADDEELYANVANQNALAFLEQNIPLFECPDADFERTWYFRWWTYRKHVKKTPDGYVITEFLPKVSWSGKHNTINCPAAHHFYEGRWLRNPQYLDDYATFWLRKGGSLRSYSFWIADAYYSRNLVSPNADFLVDLLPDLVKNYEAWKAGWDWHGFHIGQRDNGLFATIDDRDGGEVSIGGHGFRPTLNSFMYGDAKAIAAISRLAGDAEQARRFDARADAIKRLVQERLWDEQAQFFKVLPEAGAPLQDVRELYGYTPWYFNLPDPGYEAGWKELMDPRGFHAAYGPTFAEQRHPQFKVSYEGHECQWNGPSWPLATCSVLTALANLLNNYQQDVIGKQAYFDTLSIYTRSHQLKRDDGKVVPWIDENLNPYTGDWISRTRLLAMRKDNKELFTQKGGYERGKDYNHSTYNDLIITGLVGLRPRADDVVEVNPLLPDDTWDYFCLDKVRYHGRALTIIWDRTGTRYGQGKGLTVLVDGKPVAHAATLTRVTGTLKTEN